MKSDWVFADNSSKETTHESFYNLRKKEQISIKYDWMIVQYLSEEMTNQKLFYNLRENRINYAKCDWAIAKYSFEGIST